MEVILDVETKKIFDEVGGYFPDRLGISYVGTCIRDPLSGKSEMKGFFEHELDQLFSLIEQADIIIGFNCDNFDMQTLAPYYKVGKIEKFPTLDLMVRIKKSCGHRIGLDAVAQETLGVGKTGDGLDAIKFYKSGRLDELAKYCLHDVEITRDVFDYGRKHGLVKFKNKWLRPVACRVDFSYTSKKANGLQMSLL
jgi:DEAD/DEAH box helicase domain-containing protein